MTTLQIARIADLTVVRLHVEQAIESLITLLDVLDGDENLEPALAGDLPVHCDRELDTDLFEGDHQADDEPLLGRTEAVSILGLEVNQLIRNRTLRYRTLPDPKKASYCK